MSFWGPARESLGSLATVIDVVHQKRSTKELGDSLLERVRNRVEMRRENIATRWCDLEDGTTITTEGLWDMNAMLKAREKIESLYCGSNPDGQSKSAGETFERGTTEQESFNSKEDNDSLIRMHEIMLTMTHSMSELELSAHAIMSQRLLGHNAIDALHTHEKYFEECFGIVEASRFRRVRVKELAARCIFPLALQSLHCSGESLENGFNPKSSASVHDSLDKLRGVHSDTLYSLRKLCTEKSNPPFHIY